MKLRMPKDYFDNPIPPRLFLCTTGKKIIGELPAYDTNLNASWNKYSELSFSIDRQYTDVIIGETTINPLFDKAEGLRKVYAENIGYFIIQDPDTTYADKDSKSLSCFSSEHETSTKYLENFRINTGEVDSAEVMYLENIYGEGYTIDTPYELAPLGESSFDEYESYYVKEYTDTNSYTYQQVAIADASEYTTYDQSTVAKTLYKKKYPNVRFYWPTKPELSLLHLVFKKIPEWKIGNVDVSLWRKERKFDEDRIAVYDFLMNKVTGTIKCVVEWDTIENKVNFYEEAEDGITEDNTVQAHFDTDIYITRENLATEISIGYSSDDIKTKLKVTGSDDLSIRDVNLGKNHIINLDFYHNTDWMEDDLYEAYSKYLEAVEKYSPLYSKAVSARAGAYNRWNDLMNAVPAEGNVVLIGDPFEKLYCSYTPTDTAYYNATLTDSSISTYVTDLYSDKTFKTKIDKTTLSDNDAFVVQGYHFIYRANTSNFMCERNIITGTAKTALIKKLNSYHVNDDVNGNSTDNILLRLKDKDSNTVTIRIYAPPIKATSYDPSKTYYTKTNDMYTKVIISSSDIFKNYGTLYTTNLEGYQIRYEISNVSSGLVNDEEYSEINEWIRGGITSEFLQNKLNIDLNAYTVSYIGAMGAYFVLAKDETNPINLEDYGIMLLREKHDVYTKLFQTQTEQMYSQDKYQCTVSDEAPEGSIPEGARWLDSDANPVKLYIYTDGKWVVSSSTTEDQRNYENYQRYIDNYNKLQAVQQVLIEKEAEAEYCLNGYPVSDMRINTNDYIGENHLNSNGESLDEVLKRTAQKHFPDNEIADLAIDYDLPLYKFACSAYPNTYVKATAYEEDTIYYIEEYGAKIQATTQPTAENFDQGEYYILEKDYTFAVYLKDKTPYVAFASSVGVHQAKMDKYSQLTDFDNAFTLDQWIRLSPLVREDEFNDNNFLLTGYESEEERMSICQELRENASKELKTLSRPSLEFSMNMGNILALPEFNSLTSQFELGNFIRIELRSGLVKKARLLGVDLDFEDLSSFSCQFGNLVTTQDQIDLHAELMQQAVQAGKQVATSASNWQRAVDKSNKLEEDIANGLADATLEVGKASGQSIVWDQSGIWGRKLLDGTTDQYDDEQFRIINNKLLFSNDGFKTSKSVMGKFEVDGVERWGLLAEAMIGGYIEGAVMKGGELSVGGEGGTFRVNADGSVEILGPDGNNAYASKNDMTIIQDARRFHTSLEYSGSTIFSEPNSSCTITCKVYSWDDDITSDLPSGTTYSWIRASNVDDTAWNNAHANSSLNTITITNSDIETNAQFSCEVNFDSTGL